MIWTLLFTLSILLFLGAMMKQVFETNAFFRQLQKAHPDKFHELGSPRWNIQFGDTTFREATKYIRSEGFKELDDPVLDGHFRSMRNAERLAYVVAAIAIAITLFQAVMSTI